MLENLDSTLSIFDHFYNAISVCCPPGSGVIYDTHCVRRSETQGVFLAEFMTICPDNVSLAPMLQSTRQLYSDNKRPERN